MRLTGLMTILSVFFLTGILTPGTASFAKDAPTADEFVKTLPKATGDIINNKGESIGSVDIVQGTEGVIITIKADNLPAGKRGMHFHRVGDCSDLEAFQTAGGHIMPKNKPHGYFNPGGPHAGNLPNLIVHEDGSVHVELYSDLVMINEGDAKLLDEDGSTLIIHENIDDHYTQPIGGAGGPPPGRASARACA